MLTNLLVSLKMSSTVKLISKEPVTHNVNRYRFARPDGYIFTPGQATEIAINTPDRNSDFHPFTFTGYTDDSFLEFTIKSYPVKDFPNHSGMTEALSMLVPGDEILIQDPWDTFNYSGEGVFIAGGAGITPFVAILRDLARKDMIGNNMLIFSNKTAEDVIYKNEFEKIFSANPSNFINTFTQEAVDGFESGRIDKALISKYVTDFSKPFYICGPKQMKVDIADMLSELGAKVESIYF